MSREDASNLIWAAVGSFRQGSSIDYLLDGILNSLFPKTPADLHRDKLLCRDAIYSALLGQMQNRDHDSLDWIELERDAVAGAASLWAAANGYEAVVTPDDVERIETRALGHVDYASKLALYVAEFVVGVS